MKTKPNRWLSRARVSHVVGVVVLCGVCLGCAEKREDVIWPASERELVEARNYAMLNEEASLPIDQAMARLASTGRTAHSAIAPQPSADVSALEGWNGGIVERLGDAMPAECAELEAGAYTCWGELIHASECVECHSVDGVDQTKVGPNWKGVYGTMRPLEDGSRVLADDDYIKNSILLPEDQRVQRQGGGQYGVMVPQQLNDEQIKAVTEFIKSLGGS